MHSIVSYPAPLAGWPGIFTCHGGNTEVERARNKIERRKLTRLLSLWFKNKQTLFYAHRSSSCCFQIHVCNFVCLMLELCSYKPFGLLCSILYLKVLWCPVNKPCLKQLWRKKFSHRSCRVSTPRLSITSPALYQLSCFNSFWSNLNPSVALRAWYMRGGSGLPFDRWRRQILFLPCLSPS